MATLSPSPHRFWPSSQPNSTVVKFEFRAGARDASGKRFAAGQGQSGAVPAMGLGTATLHNQVCIAAVRAAIKAGYRHIDTALLYNNQEAVGYAINKAIAAGEVKREELWVTSKCWPEFEVSDLHQAMRDFANRDRRYGGLNPKKT